MEWTTYFDTAAQHWQSILVVSLASATLYLVVRVTLFMANRHNLKQRNTIWLEITPPSNVAKTPGATDHLFSVIHGFRSARDLRERLLRRVPVICCEITSTKQDGIRFLIQVEKSQSKNIQKSITSYIPDAKVKEVDPPSQHYAFVISFKQQKHYVLPITTTSPIEQHDPLSYITGAMTKLEDGEAVTMQLVITPLQLAEAKQLSKRIMHNEDVLRRVQAGQAVVPRFFDLFNTVTMGTAELFGEFFSGTTHSYRTNKTSAKEAQLQSQITKRQRPARTLSAFELELMESMHQKLNKPLFHVDLRVMVSSTSAKNHLSAFRSALDAYAMPPYQALRMKSRLPVLSKYTAALGNKRLPALHRKQGLLLSATELASLYHFPSSRISKTDNMVSSLSRTLAAPVSLKSGKPLSVLLGENQHHGTHTAIGLTEAERERHVYIIGGTGNGKTTMLQYAIVQDIKAGKGVAVIDPHGDMAETILRHIPEDRIKDVIYMNPDDLSHPIGVNLLELPEGLTGDDLVREKDIITESTISVLRKVFSEDDTGGHRIEYVLRNTIQTALTLENPTLFTIFELLNNNKYRRSVIKTIEDENLKNFWNNELGKAGDFQKVKMVAGITAKIGRFLFSGASKRVLEQEKSTIDFEDILDTNKILICNFSKGVLGEDTSALFGTTVLAKLQLASLRRARKEASQRKPFYLYVDEFQNFATMSFVQMLSEARKYKLFLTMAEQSTSQQDQQRLVDIILANVGTVICFRSGSPADERLVLPLFTPFIDQGEIANLPAYSFYTRIAAVQPQEPMSGVTVLLSDAGSHDIAQQVVKSSRKLYAKTIETQPTSTTKVVPRDVPDEPARKPASRLRRRSSKGKPNKAPIR